MSDGDLEILPAAYLKWTVRGIRPHETLQTSEFPFNDGKWVLLYSLAGPYYLSLVKVSGKCRHPFNVSVQLEGSRKGSIVTDLSEIKCFPADYPTVRPHQHVWVKREEQIVRAVPEFSKYKILKMHVVLKAGNIVKADTFSRITQTECNVRQSVSIKSISVQTTLLSNVTPCLESLSEDLTQLMADSSHHDVVFHCSGQSTRAHKLIVCKRSPVIASMLDSDMVEGRTGVVMIPDMEPDIFTQFMKYIYSGKLEDLTFDSALALYEVGDQYAVHCLSKRCTMFLVEHLSVKNACHVLCIADAHRDSTFAEEVIEYILENKIPAVNDLWSSFCDDYPKLAIKVLNHSYKLSLN